MTTISAKSTIYLVRHGETEWNVHNVIQGHTDSPLTDRGISQARALAHELKDVVFDAIYSSDLHRAERTAGIVALEKEMAVITRKLLRERSFGSYEGKTIAEYRETLKDLLTEHESLTGEAKWSYKFAPDIESDEELSGRFITIIREIAAAHPGQTVLVVTHGGCIRTFLMHAGYVPLGGLPSGAIENTAYVKFLADGSEFVISETRGIHIPGRPTLRKAIVSDRKSEAE